MYVIRARNVAEAWPKAIDLAVAHGVRGESRNGEVLVADAPVTTVYERPTERVLLDPARDQNPFFTLFESLWMLAGRDDATWLDRFVSDFSSRFAEPDGRMHGAYGKRWRGHFHRKPSMPGYELALGGNRGLDQLDEVVRLLVANPDDRQAVIQMWDPEADLGVPDLKDRPCNTQIYLRVRTVSPKVQEPAPAPYPLRRLDLTVTCRSNDIVFGCYGANAVHFSMLQEYLSARIGVGVGRYYQVSNNWHMYASSSNKVDWHSAEESARSSYPGTYPLVSRPDCFDDELGAFMDDPWAHNRFSRNTFFREVAVPMWDANQYRIRKDWRSALAAAARVAAPDWRLAAQEWLSRRAR